MTTEDVKFLRECGIDPGVGRIDHPDRSALALQTTDRRNKTRLV